MSTITQLEYIVAVFNHGHFGRAAKACHVSQPSLSAQIKKLEEELELEIFDRSLKPIAPTDAGREVVEQAKVILREHRKLSSIADLAVQEPHGDYRLGVIPTLAPQLVPRFVGHFSRSYPKATLHIDEQKTENILAMLLEGDLDVGLLVTPIEASGLETRHLFYETFFAYLNENHPLAQRKFLTANDLNPDQMWLLAEGHCFRQQVINLCSEGQALGVLPNVRFGSGSLDTLRKLVQENAGYTLLPQLAVMDLPEQEVVRHVRRFRKPLPTREVSLIYGRGLAKAPIVEGIAASIVEQLPRRIRSLRAKDLEVLDIE